MDIIGINTVATGNTDTSTRIYNRYGFKGVTGTIILPAADCLLFSVTAERDYTYVCQGDMVVVVEAKENGVTPVNFDWTDEAKARGNGSAKITVTNPDAPEAVSVFTVSMGETAGSEVQFDESTSFNGLAVIGPDTDLFQLDRTVKYAMTFGFQVYYNEDEKVERWWGDLRTGRTVRISFPKPLPPVEHTKFKLDPYAFDNAFRSPEERFEDSILAHELSHRGGLSDLYPLAVARTSNFGPKSVFHNDEMLFVPAFGDHHVPNIGNWGADGQDEVRHTKTVFGDPEIYRLVAEALVGIPHLSERSDMRNEEQVIFVGTTNRAEHLDPALFARTGIPVVLLGDFNEGGANPGYHSPDDVLIIGAHLDSLGEVGGEDVIASAGNIAVVRAGIEDLLASYREDGGVSVEVHVRDFSQLARTRANDLERIEQAVAAANALGIDTSQVASKRDAALARLEVFADRFESGGEQSVTEGESAVIMEVFGELWGIHEELNTCVSHWHHYKQHEANHDAWVKRLADRKRNFRVADDAQDNRIATSYVTYAANPEETLAASKAAFVELFQAIQKGDLGAAHKADTQARHFSTREHMLDALIRRGKLVAVEDNSTTA